jgi:hypothetical protein
LFLAVRLSASGVASRSALPFRVRVGDVFKTLAALAGVVTLPTVSRVTARWDRPQPLRNVQAGRAGAMPAAECDDGLEAER